MHYLLYSFHMNCLMLEPLFFRLLFHIGTAVPLTLCGLYICIVLQFKCVFFFTLICVQVDCVNFCYHICFTKIK